MITKKNLLKLWLPLAIMWIVMALEQPLITSVISRLDDALNQLAAFGFSFAIALLIEGPVIQMLSAGTAVTPSKQSYRKILSIMNYIAVIATLVHLILCIPSVFRFISVDLMGLPEELLKSAYYCFVSLIPWAATIGYRRLWQGVMIKHGRSKYVPIVMYIRLIIAIVILLLGYIFKPFSGALLGGIALCVGVISGMISSYIFAKPCIEALPEEASYEMSFKGMLRFYIPLAITSWITLGVRPLLNFGIVKGLFPVESLAVWPVILAYIFLYTSICQSLQEIIIAEYKKENLKVLRSFVNNIATIMVVLYFAILMIKPLLNFWFFDVSKLPTSLSEFLTVPLLLFMVMPFLSASISWYRGVLVSTRKTTNITMGVFFNVLSMFIVIIFIPMFFKIPGVYLASLAYCFAYLVEASFLAISVRREKINQ